MKKLLVSLLIILSVGSQSCRAAEMFESPADLENFDNKFYEAPGNTIPDVNYTTDSVEDYKRFNERYTNPLFKRLRIKLTNMYRVRAHKQDLIEAERQQKIEEEELEREREALSEFDYLFEKKNSPKEEDVKAEEVTTENIEGSNVKAVELSGAVKEAVVPKDLQMDCDKLVYYEDRNELEAIGNANIKLPTQDITLQADKFVYNTASNILKAYGAVTVTKGGNVIHGDNFEVNVNEETSFMNNINSVLQYMSLDAESASTTADTVVLNKGKFYSKNSHKLFLRTRMVGADLSRMLVDEDDRSIFGPEGEQQSTVRIDASDISIDAKKNHNKIKLTDADIYYGGKSLFSIPSLTVYTNKNNDYFEGNYPEIGSIPRIGIFAGPGVVFMTPFDSTIKLIPTINYKDKVGVGGIVRYKSATNMTDAAYFSSSDLWYVKGRQRLDDNFFLQYGMNAYMDDWFMGRRMGKYAAEFVYEDRFKHRAFLGEGRDMQFRHRFGAGYFHDNDINRHGERITSPEIGTTRFKYMAEIFQSLYKYQGQGDLKLVELGLALQGAASIYGTGDTQFIARVGPRVHTQYKYWMQDIGYFQSGYSDESPLPRFDTYRYGHSNVYLREAFRVHKYVTLGWSGSLNLSDDAPNGKMFQENAFIIALGPDELKLSLGYDFVRSRTYFSFLVNMDTKGSSVNFNKMEIKNPDKMARNNDEEQLITFEKPGEAKPKQLQYATVIELEDPDKEQL